MRCLSLTQPWASLVSLSVKNIETRSWSTPYRGNLAIHAAKSFPPWAREFAEQGPALDYLPTRNAADLPRGVVIATCELVDCKRITEDLASYIREYGGPEIEFGDYAVGRFAWILRDIRPLPEPVPARGAFGLWEWEPVGLEVRMP